MDVIMKRFVQSGDDQQEDPDEPQHLDIASLDSGAGTFVSIKTDRWVVESEEEIDALAKNLKAALMVNVFPNHANHGT